MPRPLRPEILSLARPMPKTQKACAALKPTPAMAQAAGVLPCTLTAAALRGELTPFTDGTFLFWREREVLAWAKPERVAERANRRVQAAKDRRSR